MAGRLTVKLSEQARTATSTLLSSLCAAPCRVRCSWSSAYILAVASQIMTTTLEERLNFRLEQHDAPQLTSEKFTS
jgi:hypothetical protein